MNIGRLLRRPTDTAILKAYGNIDERRGASKTQDSHNTRSGPETPTLHEESRA